MTALLKKARSDAADIVSTAKEEAPKDPTMADYPLRLIGLVRENLSRFSPDVQLGILEGFQEMTVDDLTDLDTWKGMAYMFAY